MVSAIIDGVYSLIFQSKDPLATGIFKALKATALSAGVELTTTNSSASPLNVPEREPIIFTFCMLP